MKIVYILIVLIVSVAFIHSFEVVYREKAAQENILYHAIIDL